MVSPPKRAFLLLFIYSLLNLPYLFLNNKKCRSHRLSFTADAAAIYSASVVEAATVACLLLCQVIAAPFMMKT